LFAGKEYQVTGTSFAPNDGRVIERDFGIDSSADPSLDLLSATCALCNSTTISFDPAKGRFVPVGEATEAALRILSEKLGTSDSLLNAEILMKRRNPEHASLVCDYYTNVRFERIATLDFDRDRKSMSVVVRDRKSGQLLLLVKGAPESILERCKTTPNRREISSQIAKYGKDALRTLAFAYRPLPEVPAQAILADPLQYFAFEGGLTFLGLAAMMDPPRPEIAESLRRCQAAGIRVIVLTGDNKETAEAIGKRIGLFSEDEPITAELSLTGAVFDALSEEDQLEVLRFARLFSRVEPRHKSRLVALLQKSGHVVAMTGDGVNDAPALKRADIGIAMGSGTDVAKGAADLVLVDDNFATIIEAVREGRAIYANTKQFIRYLISSNIGEVACVLGTAFLGLPEVLSPVQLLWVNLVTDGLPATALGFNPHSPRSMQEPPRASNEPLVGTWLFVRYLIVGCYVGFATIAGFVWTLWRSSGASWWELRQGSLNTRLASSVALSVLVVIEMFNALNALSETESLLVLTPFANLWLIGAVVLSIVLHLGILYVEALANVFNVLPLSKADWILVVSLSIPVVLIDEILKLISRHRVKKIKRD
jgi:Ca2+ transporting ATPase